MASSNLSLLRASFEKVSHVENILLNLIKNFPLGLLLIEYPSRRCVLMNEIAQHILPSSLVGKEIYSHPNYLIDGQGLRYDCVKIGSYSFAVGEKQYISLLLAKPKPKEENYGESVLRV